MVRIRRFILTVIMCGAALSAQGATQKPYSWDPDTETHSGRIDSVDLKSRQMIVGDMPFMLSLYVKVHRSYGRPSSQLDIQAGRYIRFKTEGKGPEYPSDGNVVTDIWIIKK